LSINIKKALTSNSSEWVNAIPRVKVSNTKWEDVKKIWVKKSSTEWKSVYEQETVYIFPEGSGTALNPTVINDVDLGGNDADGNPYFTVDQKLKDCRVIVPENVALVASTTLKYALKTGSGYGGKLTLQVDGRVLGRGGNGSQGSSGGGSQASYAGTACLVQTDLHWEVGANGHLSGGGGGGASGGAAEHYGPTGGTFYLASCGGGGGAPYGLGGHSEQHNLGGIGNESAYRAKYGYRSLVGNDATLFSAGTGGYQPGDSASGLNPWHVGYNPSNPALSHGRSGNGGEYGQAGQNGVAYTISTTGNNTTGGIGGTSGNSVPPYRLYTQTTGQEVFSGQTFEREYNMVAASSIVAGSYYRIQSLSGANKTPWLSFTSLDEVANTGQIHVGKTFTATANYSAISSLGVVTVNNTYYSITEVTE